LDFQWCHQQFDQKLKRRLDVSFKSLFNLLDCCQFCLCISAIFYWCQAETKFEPFILETAMGFTTNVLPQLAELYFQKNVF
jgi:hypothetical protein